MIGELAAGFAVGAVLGFLLKRSGLCFTGLSYEGVFQRQGSSLVLFFMAIAVEAVIYHGLGHAGLISIPSFLPPFSLVGVGLGSLLFGVGAVLAGGCLVSTLVKCGDGRVEGYAALAAFLVAGYSVSAGFALPVTAKLRSMLVVQDALPGRLGLLPLALALAAVAVLGLCVARRRKQVVSLARESQGAGPLFWLRRKAWSRERSVVVIGVVLGAAFLVSEQFGRSYGCAAAMPLLSWVFSVVPPDQVMGGCNPYDVVLGWGSGFVAGICFGSLLAAVASGAFRLVFPTAMELVGSVAGGLLMGCGAMWGAGCLLSNGLVGTAQFSAKSWWALLFLMGGIWLGGVIARWIAKGREA